MQTLNVRSATSPHLAWQGRACAPALGATVAMDSSEIDQSVSPCCCSEICAHQTHVLLTPFNPNPIKP